jgi:hypothetical protein
MLQYSPQSDPQSYEQAAMRRALDGEGYRPSRTQCDLL